MTDSKTEVRSHCSVTSAAVPTEINCKYCGAPLEIWSDDTEVTCSCGSVIILEKQDEGIDK